MQTFTTYRISEAEVLQAVRLYLEQKVPGVQIKSLRLDLFTAEDPEGPALNPGCRGAVIEAELTR